MGTADFGFKTLRAGVAGLLALMAVAGPAAALSLDETVLSAGGTGSVVTGIQQLSVASKALITPIDPFGGFAEYGVFQVTGLLDAAGQPIASGLGTNYGIYMTYLVTGTAAPVPGTANMVIQYSSASLLLFADRNNDSTFDLIPGGSGPGGLPVELAIGNMGDDAPIAINTGTNFTGATTVMPISATQLLGFTDATVYDWLLQPFGSAALAGELFPNGLHLVSSTVTPIVPTGVGPILLSSLEIGSLTFIPEPGSLALAAVGGVAGLAGRRRRRH